MHARCAVAHPIRQIEREALVEVSLGVLAKSEPGGDRRMDGRREAAAMVGTGLVVVLVGAHDLG